MKSTTFKHTLSILTLGLMGLAAGGAQAGWGYDHDAGYNASYRHAPNFSEQINARQDRQMQRIQAGFRNGMLTRFETRELMRQQAGIRDMERHFRSDDGRIDAREFQRLDHALDMAARNIRDEKTDRQARNGYGDTYAHDHRPWYN